MSINENILKEITKSLKAKRPSGGDDDSSSSSSLSSSSTNNGPSNNGDPDPGDDPSDPSSDSSISSAGSRNKSKKRTKKHKAKSKAAKQHKYYTTLFNKLCKAAKNHRLGNMSKLGTNPIDNRIFFTEWIDTLKDVFNTHHRTMTILDDFPNIPQVPSLINKVIAGFLRAHMNFRIKHLLGATDMEDGVGIIRRLQQLFAPATPEDRMNAVQHLHQLQMNSPREPINDFVKRFRRALNLLTHVSCGQPLPNEFEQVSLFLQKLLAKLPDGDLRATALRHHYDLKKSKDLVNPPYPLSQIEYDLCQIENARHGIRLNTTQVQGTRNPTFSRTNQRPRFRLQSRPYPMSTQHEAHSTTNPRRGSSACFKCGGPHLLRNCPHATPEERDRLYRQHGLQRNNYSNNNRNQFNRSRRPQRPTRPPLQPTNGRSLPNNQANTVIRPPTPPLASHTRAAAATNTAVRITSSNNPRWASANSSNEVHHETNHIEVLSSKNQDLNNSGYTNISEWLVDSGCSIHMTPYESDLITDKKKSNVLVQVANGNIVKAQSIGTTRIKINDITGKPPQDVLLEEVLYIPGLSRRLFSVSQWTNSGGVCSFGVDKCTLSYKAPNDNISFSQTIHAPFNLHHDTSFLTPTTALQTQAKTPIPSNLLHRRLGHRSITALGAASEADIWADSTLQLEAEEFCWDCKVAFSRKANRGKSSLDSDPDIKAGEYLMLDIQTNPGKVGLTKSTTFTHFLQVTDAVSRFTVLLGLPSVSSADVFAALLHFVIWFKPNATFYAWRVKQLRTDAGTAFTSSEFISDCEQHGVKVSFAAPRHQEMNGIAERAWGTIKNIAFAHCVHARVGYEFMTLALEHAWKVHACLPIRDVLQDGRPISPFESFFQEKPSIRRFRVLFCPCVANAGPRKDKRTGRILDRRNNPERGIRGIHVGLPRHAPGWLVYIPSTGEILNSCDVVFDEDFLSTLSYTRVRFPGGLKLQPPSHPSFVNEDDIEYTDDPLKFATNEDAPDYPCDKNATPITPFAPNPTVGEYFHQNGPQFEEENHFLHQDAPDFEEESPSQNLLSFPKSVTFDDSTSFDIEDSQSRRSMRLAGRTPYYHGLMTDHIHPSSNDLSYMQSAFNTEVDDASGQPADMFEPAPLHWKQLFKLPSHLKRPWKHSFRKELETLIKKMGTFAKEEPRANEPIIPVTAKARVKIKSDGTVDKLKIRICLRGDKQAELVDWDTWCPIAGFRELKLFLSFAARFKCRVFQLDFIGAFLQAEARNRVFTVLPKEWAEEFPDLAEWFGKPLRLLKSLYGQVDASKNWDDDLSDWLINTFGFERCPGAGSIYLYHKPPHYIFLLNAVDDQLYFSNSDELRKTFEQGLNERFEIEFLHQAHWYLQARMTQHANYSITLDQARYMALILSRFLPTFSVDNVSSEDKAKYTSPLPSEFVPSIQDKSKDLFEVKNLETDFGFQYSSVVGMLIFLMNTTTELQYAIRKLAKFNALPGKKHFKAIIHLLHYIRTHRLELGLKFYSPEEKPPIQNLLAKTNPDFKFEDYPIILFSDSSWQDCPDTSRSTGCYLLYIYGSLADGASFVPNPVAMSSAQAEYNACAFATIMGLHVVQVFNKFHNTHADSPVTMALFVDSSSAIAMMKNEKDSKQTRHIQRRVHFVRAARVDGTIQPLKIPGTENPSDIGTKNLGGPPFHTFHNLLHVKVPP